MTVSYFAQNSSRAVSWKRAALMGFALGAQLLIANQAAAQEACGEITCGKGFTCETMSGACPAIDCGDSADCKPCEPKEFKACVPAKCTSSSECGPDQVCYERYVYDCAPTAGPACPPGEKCASTDLVAPTPCEATPVSYCTPRWQVPCSAAADCGAGFDCVPEESCSTPGSPGTGAGTPGSTPPDAALPPEGEERAALPAPPTTPPETTCAPTGISRCVAVEVACNADSDCISGWTCQANPEGVCWSRPDGNGCEPADPAKICVPPYSGSSGGVPDGAPASGEDFEEPGTPTATPLPQNPQPAPGAGTPPAEDAGSSDPVPSDDGCSVSAAPSGAGGLAWLALGLAGVLGLRRRR